jgi:hypothetical protein
MSSFLSHLLLKLQKRGEILIKKVIAPKEINEGEMFEVKVVIENRMIAQSRQSETE